MLSSLQNHDYLYYRWAQEDTHHLTDKLLTLIEDNVMWKVAFGFDKGDVGHIPAGGKKVKDHHRAIAIKLFLDPKEPFGAFTHDDIEKLDDVIKNRINTYVWGFSFTIITLTLHFSLKTQYGKYRKMISETGQGLIDEGREDEIIPGSEIANLWGNVIKLSSSFPTN